MLNALDMLRFRIAVLLLEWRWTWKIAFMLMTAEELEMLKHNIVSNIREIYEKRDKTP
jgi:hypothetical protein